MKTNLRYHPSIYTAAAPVVGTVVSAHTVRHETWGRVGVRLEVKRPGGQIVYPTASEFDREVRRATPKNVHLFQPDVKAGECREFAVDGYSWFGTVEKVGQESFVVRPEPLTLPDGRVFTDGGPMKIGEVGCVTRRSLQLFMQMMSVAHCDWQRRVSVASPDYHAAREEFQKKEDEARSRYPDVTDAEIRALGY